MSKRSHRIGSGGSVVLKLEARGLAAIAAARLGSPLYVLRGSRWVLAGPRELAKATCFPFGDTAGVTNAPDAIDQASAHPDFIAEIYPGGGGIPQVLPKNAPPAFLLVANDDRSHANGVLKLFSLYFNANIPVEIHGFTKGGHAFGMGTRSRLTTIKDWQDRLADWMGDNNILDPAVPAKGVK